MKTTKFMMMLFALSSFTTMAFAQSKTVTDSELKKNTTPITGALGYINQMQPVTYQYNTQQFKNLKLPAGTQYGFNANDVQRVLPGIVKTESVLYPVGKNQYRSADITKVDVQSLVPVLLGAIKEQQQQIDDLKAEVKALRQNAPSTAAVVR
jgi:hypothetical protein